MGLKLGLAARRGLAVALVALLAACGGGGGGGSTGSASPPPPVATAPAGDYFPLNVGDRWAYGTDPAGGSLVLVTKTQPVTGGVAMVVRTMSNKGLSDELYLKDATGVRLAPGPFPDAAIADAGPLLMLKLPLVSGDRWVVVDGTGHVFSNDGDYIPDDVTLRIEATVVGFESLTVGSTSYSQVAHVQTTSTRSTKQSKDGQMVTVTTVSDDWYAPDIGRVRNRITVTPSSGAPTTAEASLSTWRVAARRSETTAPRVVSKSPDTGALAGGCCLGMSVEFSEVMDVEPDAPPMQLTGPDGKPVGGGSGWARDGRRVTFAPSAPLASGTYTARVTTANRDVAGNALPAEVSWQFNVDGSAPAITPVLPLADAKDVPLDSKIIFTVEADTDLSKLTADRIAITAGSGYVGFDLSVSGNTVTLTPRAPLQRGVRHHVGISGVTDKLGNLSAAGWSFDTDPGRFAAPQALTTADVTAAAIGDLDGDGRNDVVLALGADPSTPASPTLQVFLGQPGGTFSAARTLDTAAGYRDNITSLAVADLDGPGKAAIVAGNALTAVQVLRRQADGRHAVSQVIDTPAGRVVRVADMNGDGRPDLVGRPAVGAEVQVWLQAPDGRFGGARAVALHAGGFGSLAVGDLNGDGRPDLVTGGGTGFVGQDFGIARQRADGSFEPARYLAASPSQLVQGVAIGDLNGDGRQDLVATLSLAAAVTVMQQDAAGQLLPGVNMPAAYNAHRVHLVDIDGDGRLDVLSSATRSPIVVALQRSDGTLGAGETFPIAGYSDSFDGVVAVGDLDGDGRSDILYGGYWLRQRAVTTPPASAASGIQPTGMGLGRLLRPVR